MCKFKFLFSKLSKESLKTFFSTKLSIGIVTGVVVITPIIAVSISNHVSNASEHPVVLGSAEKVDSDDNVTDFINIADKYRSKKNEISSNEKVADKEQPTPKVSEESSVEEDVAQVVEGVNEPVYTAPVEEVVHTDVSNVVENTPNEVVNEAPPAEVPQVPEAPVEEVPQVKEPVFSYTAEVVVPAGTDSTTVMRNYINLVAIDSNGNDCSADALIYKGAPTQDGRVFFSFGVTMDGVMYQGKVFYTAQ